MTCKRENNILCNSNGSHLSGQTRQIFFCGSASALSLPSSARRLWVIRKVLQCHSEPQPWHRPCTLIPVPRSLRVRPGGRGTTTDPPSASYHTSMNAPGQAFWPRCQTTSAEAGQGEKPICCCVAVSAHMVILY